MAGREPDDLAEELLVDLAQDVGRQHGELVGAVRVVEALEDALEGLVVDGQLGGQLGGRLGASRRWGLRCLDVLGCGVFLGGLYLVGLLFFFCHSWRFLFYRSNVRHPRLDRFADP